MKNLFCWYKHAAIVALVLGMVEAAWCQGLSITAATLDSSGNLVSVTDPGGVINAQLPACGKLYSGGYFNNVTFGTWDAVHHYWVLTLEPSGQTIPVYGAPQSGLSANNVFYLVYTPPPTGPYLTAYTLSNGYYGGSGNGVNGEVWDLANAANCDIYIGGTFTEAGGFTYSSGIGFYGYEYGWNTAYIFSVANGVYKFTWVNGNKLKCQGNTLNPTINLTSGSFNGNGSVSFSSNVGYFNLYSGQFGMYDYWSAQ